jgi:nitrate/nitrite transport system ATP-binding protein
MQSYVQIENAGMVFSTKKGKFTALTDINLHVDQGEFIALIGHSGCGKSTLLNLVAGLLTTDARARQQGDQGRGRSAGGVPEPLLLPLSAFENVYPAVEKVLRQERKQLKAAPPLRSSWWVQPRRG